MFYYYRFISLLVVILSTFTTIPNTYATTIGNEKNIDSKISPVIQSLMAKDDIPGVAIIVVKDNQVVFKKGYGFADPLYQTSVNPDTSIFHVGSVTKLFTGTAAMQLYEQGKLDLHASINHYLKKLNVDEPFGKPITMANLLTHTGGLHYKLLGTVAPFGKEPEPLNKHLAKALPPIARTPGLVSVYSNYGIALAGHVIESVSDKNYQSYIRENLLTPLEMTQSGLKLTPEHSKNFAMPGASKANNFPPKDFNHSNFSPATDLYSTASDIGKFMLMQLNNGNYKGKQILKPETIKLMQQRQFSSHPSAFSWTYTFREANYNGHHAIGHSGSWFDHLGRVTLVPEEKLGIYVVMNKRSKRIMTETTQAVIDLYLPPKSIRKPTRVEQPTTPLTEFEGYYTTGQMTTPYTERLMMISEPKTTFKITAEDNALIAKGEKYYEVEPGFFLREDGLRNLSFTKDPASNDLYASFNGSGGSIKITIFETPKMQGILLVVFFLMALSGVILQKYNTATQTPSVRLLYKLNTLAIALSILFIPIVITILLNGEALKLHIATPLWIEGLFKLPILIILLFFSVIFLFLWNIVKGELRAYNSVITQLLITGSLVLYLSILANWNLITNSMNI